MEIAVFFVIMYCLPLNCFLIIYELILQVFDITKYGRNFSINFGNRFGTGKHLIYGKSKKNEFCFVKINSKKASEKVGRH